MNPITKYTMLMPIHWLLGTGGPLIGWKNGSIFMTNCLMRTVGLSRAKAQPKFGQWATVFEWSNPTRATFL